MRRTGHKSPSPDHTNNMRTRCHALSYRRWPVCRKLTSAVSWGSSLDNHKIHWLRWEKLTRSKSQGGIGFRDFSLFNQAMSGKQGWRLLMRPNSLCARVLKGKYIIQTVTFSQQPKKGKARRRGDRFSMGAMCSNGD
jgi:hypothetical protein